MKNLFSKDKKVVSLILVFGFLFSVALLSPFIASDLPLMIKKEDSLGFPILNPDGSILIKINGVKKNIVYSQTDWKKDNHFTKVFTIIPWSPGKTDVLNANYIGPFDKQYRSTNNVS